MSAVVCFDTNSVQSHPFTLSPFWPPPRRRRCHTRLSIGVSWSIAGTASLFFFITLHVRFVVPRVNNQAQRWKSVGHFVGLLGIAHQWHTCAGDLILPLIPDLTAGCEAPVQV